MEDRVRQEHIDALGDDFGRVYNAVWSEWCSAKMRYEELRELFGTQEKCDLLNAVSPAFFGDIQQLFWHDLMLHVTRLTDKSGKALKVQSLERFLTGDPDLLKQVRKHREDATSAAKPRCRLEEPEDRPQRQSTGNRQGWATGVCEAEDL